MNERPLVLIFWVAFPGTWPWRQWVPLTQSREYSGPMECETHMRKSNQNNCMDSVMTRDNGPSLHCLMEASSAFILIVKNTAIPWNPNFIHS